MTAVRLSLGFVFVCAAIIFAGCNAGLSPLCATSPPPRDDLLRFVEGRLGADWYGIYLESRKTGFLKCTTRRRESREGPRYVLENSGVIKVASGRDVRTISIHVVSEFGAHPPFPLLRYRDRTAKEDEISEIEVFRTAAGYQVAVTQGKKTHTRKAGFFQLGLEDYTAVQRWVSRGPKTGDSVDYASLNPVTFEPEVKTSRITAVRSAIVSGVDTTYYEVTSAGAGGIRITELFGADGRALRIGLGGQFECRLEPQELATRVEAPVDLFVGNTVPVDRKLGAPETVTFLRMAVNGASDDLIENAPGQTVKAGPVVTLDPVAGMQIRATPGEIKENLSAPTPVPLDHPAIVRLALRAAGDARTTAEKVERLVEFVWRFIEDDYTADPLTLMDIIAKRKGDCGEHAELFTALARALRIPCRKVGGLVYLGDDVRGFGLHAWNEVVVDGRWMPVDPTWGQRRIDATHVRFSLNTEREWQMMAAIPGIELKVLRVDRGR